MAGKAKTRKTFGRKLKDQDDEISNIYGLAGSRNTPTASTMSFAGAGISSTPPTIDVYSRLKTSGDTMIGAIAFYPKIAIPDGNGAIDLMPTDNGATNDDYSSYLIVTGATNPDDLVTLSNPMHTGQLIHIEANTTGDIVLKHNTGNIFIPSGSDHTIPAGGFATLIFDSVIHTNKWTLISSSSTSSGANTSLSNLAATTALNSSLVMTGNSVTDLQQVSFRTAIATPVQGSLYFDGTDVQVKTGGGTKNLSNIDSGANTDLSNLTATGESKFVKAADDVTWTGDHIFDTTAAGSTTTSPVKFQGDGGSSAQRVLEIGEYGNHSVKFIAELEGDVGREMSNPDGGADIPVPPTSGGVSIEPTLSIKSAIVMNTYTMYDLDTLVFSQSGSSTTPPPEDDWVYIEANTGTSGSPNLTGMTYNVPTSKTHQFKVNGSLKISIDDDIEFATGSTLEIQNTISSSPSLANGGSTALPSNPTAYFKVKYNGADRYIPYYTAS